MELLDKLIFIEEDITFWYKVFSFINIKLYKGIMRNIIIAKNAVLDLYRLNEANFFKTFWKVSMFDCKRARLL